MRRKSFNGVECPVTRSIEVVGEWWSILIMRDALQGIRRFDDFSRSLEIAPNMLTRRLNSLVDNGLLRRVQYSEKPARFEYLVTDKGEDFRIVIFALMSWGNRHLAPEGESLQVVEAETSLPLELVFRSKDGRIVELASVSVQAGPAASKMMRERLSQRR
ncbi:MULTISPECIES: winged helix-turn-helix transcriptional regulator [Pseudomonas syringae group genomosp. 2]|uniref:Uncharacterized protein pph38 n=1 Tax=Pseudomonas savastanoi pv. phaseolicola TaxID=319 RepID=Q4LBL9_PSESH|nr:MULTISPECIES: helix-turn-helix domain-containing protein [Pseudomonas syringae group genomosp. 2]CAI36079.1 hypothetical protein [Pseudomonas savastanoi pv. phaseolicola]